MSADAAAYREGTDLTLWPTGVAAVAINRSGRGAKRASREGGVMRAGRTGKTDVGCRERGLMDGTSQSRVVADKESEDRQWCGCGCVRRLQASRVSSLGLQLPDRTRFRCSEAGDEVCWRGPRPTAASKLGGAGVLDAVSQEWEGINCGRDAQL
jgi:hypothetical protein